MRRSGGAGHRPAGERRGHRTGTAGNVAGQRPVPQAGGGDRRRAADRRVRTGGLPGVPGRGVCAGVPQQPGVQHARSGGAGVSTAFIEIPRLVRAEFVKLRTVRSTVITLIALTVPALAAGLFLATRLDPEPGRPVNPEHLALTPLVVAVFLVELAVIMLGSTVLTSEYHSGMIRSSITAMPRRGRLLAAKLLAVTLLSAGFGLLLSLVVLAVSVPAVQAEGFEVPLTGLVPAVVLGVVLYLPMLAVFSAAVAAVVRGSGATFTIMLMSVFVLPNVIGFVPWAGDWLERYWPPAAGFEVVLHSDKAGVVSPALGYAVFALATALLVAGANQVLQRRAAV
ncbi:hypothetical protein D5S17_34580 [Pseudonocardiaceae bacterium YIM PH 21723]|nr:hypothetical protein D5S17_34580 [Pseudonocardiaceae bacterium YIM PH 21723]